MPVEQQKPDEPGPVAQAVEVWAEGPEISPYATQFVPPYPEAMQTNYTGYSGTGNPNDWTTGGDGTAGSLSQVPETVDLEWWASDTAMFSFFFPNVCWVETDPSPTLTTWAKTVWKSQVRTDKAFYYGYWWPPVFPLGRFVMEFTVTSSYAEPSDPTKVGTTVYLTGHTMWPGTYKWDLQAQTYPDPVNQPTVFTTRTLKAGTATIHGEVTSDMLYPPSNWGVYPYA